MPFDAPSTAQLPILRAGALLAFVGYGVGCGSETENIPPEGTGGTLSSEVAFTLQPDDLVPEGIAFDEASGSFFVGSTFHRSVTKITPTDSLGFGLESFAAADRLRCKNLV